ncbi:MAG: DAK2 domain-containing protein [Chloroflexi bacterium]|nr:DAK2 domain-containing protein [Chloroflexota bacterium]
MRLRGGRLNAGLQLCDGPTMRGALQSATNWLERHVAAINALNVFPVPDGDTGTNMLLTMRAALAEAATCSVESVGVLLSAVAHGALMGARGNSGVILSQILGGLHKGIGDRERFSADDFAAGLKEATTSAYAGVLQPMEGTILTVMRWAAEAASRKARRNDDIIAVLRRAVTAAQEAVATTPSLLPLLRAAGVVDAGGQGLLILLQGMLAHLQGEPLAAEEEPVGEVWGRAQVEEGATYGHCTEFVVTGQDFDLKRIRAVVATFGDSVMVVGDQRLARVHVHTYQPGALLKVAEEWGEVSGAKAQDIQAQYQAFLGQQTLPSVPQRALVGQVAVIAVAPSTQLAEVFQSVGASGTVLGGPGQNPSTAQLLTAITEAPSAQAIILPNHPNIFPAAEQAKALCSKEVMIVPSRDIGQGMAALLAYNYQSDLETNAEKMRKAVERVATVEITEAVRDATFGSRQIRQGQILALKNDELVAVGDGRLETTMEALERMDLERRELLTIYSGAEAQPGEAESLSTMVRQRWADLTVEVVEGKQPFQIYLLAAE